MLNEYIPAANVAITECENICFRTKTYKFIQRSGVMTMGMAFSASELTAVQ